MALCGGVQAGSPVDSFAAPEPGDMPGYEDPVIMAAGAFTINRYWQTVRRKIVIIQNIIFLYDFLFNPIDLFA